MSASDAQTQAFAPRPDLLTESIDGEMLILDLTNDNHFSLNASATLIWQAMAHEPATKADLLQSLRARYSQVPIEELETDLDEILNTWLEQGLIHPIA